MTYRSIFGSFCTATLDGHQMTLMLETLRSDETLDARSFGVRLLALVLRLNLTANDETADLPQIQSVIFLRLCRLQQPNCRRNQRAGTEVSLTSSSLLRLKNLRIFVALLGPNRFACSVSVNPGISPSPCFTTASASTLKSIPTIHPLTLFLLRSPVLLGL